MKSTALVCVLLTLFATLASCGGSGNRLIQTRQVSGFHSVELSGPLKVFLYVEPGISSPSCTLAGDDNVVARMETLVEAGVLHLCARGTRT